MRSFVPVSAAAIAFCLLGSTSSIGQPAAAKDAVAAFVGAWGGYGSVGSSIGFTCFSSAGCSAKRLPDGCANSGSLVVCVQGSA